MDCESASAEHAPDIISDALESGHPYHAIIVDYDRPEIVRQLAEAITPRCQQDGTKLIFTGAPDQADLRKPFWLTGVSAFLSKPLRRSRLFDCLAEGLNSKHSGDDASKKVLQTAAQKSKNVQYEDERILVVDDHPTNARLAFLQLDKLGYHADCVSNGRQALQAVASRAYSLILMDCQMPEMDGFESTQAIRKLEETTGKRVPIIAMTADSSSDGRDHCLAIGMSDYITKPVAFKKLSAVLEKWLPHKKSKTILSPLAKAESDSMQSPPYH